MRTEKKPKRLAHDVVCENCGVAGQMIVWIHKVETTGRAEYVEGLRDCLSCRGIIND